MTIDNFTAESAAGGSAKIERAEKNLELLLDELRLREMPEEIVFQINEKLEHLKTLPKERKGYVSAVQKTQKAILQLLEKNLKIVPKNYYKNMGLALGIGAFGVPLGLAYGMAMGNSAYIGVGIPFGLAIGLSLGKKKDKKAEAEGRQLKFDVSSI